MANNAGAIDKAKAEVKQQANQAVRNPWFERMARLGYLMRGVVYFVIGLLAIQLALGAGGAAKSQQGAIELIGQGQAGPLLLALVAIGLAGYALWGFVRAILDPLHKGDEPKGMLARLGYLVSGISYGALVIPTVQYLVGHGSGNGGANTQDWTARLLHLPFGPMLIGLVGLAGIGAGLAQIYIGYKQDFKKDFNLAGASTDERLWIVRLGRFGIMARGVVFAIIGWFFVRAALTVDPAQARGMDGALLEVARQPYGTFLLAVVALGLLAFGLYSALAARWARIPS